MGVRSDDRDVRGVACHAAGPLVGGLTETLGWRAVFWLLVPLSAIALLIGMKAGNRVVHVGI
jgi:MFS family permease